MFIGLVMVAVGIIALLTTFGISPVNLELCMGPSFSSYWAGHHLRRAAGAASGTVAAGRAKIKTKNRSPLFSRTSTTGAGRRATRLFTASPKPSTVRGDMGIARQHTHRGVNPEALLIRVEPGAVREMLGEALHPDDARRLVALIVVDGPVPLRQLVGGHAGIPTTSSLYSGSRYAAGTPC